MKTGDRVRLTRLVPTAYEVQSAAMGIVLQTTSSKAEVLWDSGQQSWMPSDSLQVVASIGLKAARKHQIKRLKESLTALRHRREELVGFLTKYETSIQALVDALEKKGT